MTTHTTTYLYVFSIQQALEWDFLPKSWPFLHDFSFLAPTSILALFGPFWPTLARWPNSGGPWSGHQWCFPTYTHHAPCKKPRPAQGDDMRSFWDTPQSSIQKNDFHCTLLDRCRAINEEKWTKFVSFWKIFLCSFKWDWPKILSPNGVKDISLLSWMVKTPKSSTTTTAVIWHFSNKIPIYFCFFG